MSGDFDAHTDAFKQVLTPDSRVEEIAGGMIFTEGPVWFTDGEYLLFTDVEAGKIMCWSAKDGLTVWREDSGHADGQSQDRQGRLVTAGFLSRVVSRTEPDGSVTVLADSYQGNRFNSPNDIIVKSNGSLWFTDPVGGRRFPGFADLPAEQPKQFVFRLDPETREPVPVADDVQYPNGLCFSPDEKLLYIADSAGRKVTVFDVKDDDTLANGRFFAAIDPGFPDGMRTDTEGRLYSTAADGIHVFSSQGEFLGKILVEQTPANCAFGGPGMHDLFLTAQHSLYKVTLASTGVRQA